MVQVAQIGGRGGGRGNSGNAQKKHFFFSWGLPLLRPIQKQTKTIFKPVWKLYLDVKLHPIWHLANSHTIILLYYLTFLQGRRRGGDKLEKGFASFCSIGGKGSLQSYLLLILWINPDFLPVPKTQFFSFKKRNPRKVFQCRSHLELCFVRKTKIVDKFAE